MKDLAYYKRLPYTRVVWQERDTDGTIYWRAEYRELRGCSTEGNSEAEAIWNLQQLFDEYMQMRIDEGGDIPEPVFALVS
jgi:predicted RNase H-like HicB family nuclease